MNISIIIPFFNECENIAGLKDVIIPVVNELLIGNHSDAPKIERAELVFIDDGSLDGSLETLKSTLISTDESNILFKFERHNTNLGLGAALRTGFSLANGDVIITTDSDGTYHFSTIPLLLSFLGPSVDIVTASPYHPQGKVVGVPMSRLILSRGSSFLYRLLVDWHIHTYTALFRAYRSDVINSVGFGSNGFLAGTELMVKAILRGYRVAEYPAVLNRRSYGVSKAKIYRTIREHLRFQALIALHRAGIRSLL